MSTHQEKREAIVQAVRDLKSKAFDLVMMKQAIGLTEMQEKELERINEAISLGEGLLQKEYLI